LAKSLRITIFLAVLVAGVGHIYLGLIKRGITILIFGFIFSIATPALVPEPYSWLIIIGYWAWQIWDAYHYYKKLNAVKPEVEK
jgi:hypothetical protein